MKKKIITLLVIPIILAGSSSAVAVEPKSVAADDVQQWTDCSEYSFGTMLLCSTPEKCAGDWIRPIDVMTYANDQFGVKGLVGTGAPSDYVRDEMFGKLPGWTRTFMRGTYDTLVNIHKTATIFGMEDMYECFAYGPESPHSAGEEALDPVYWVPQAEALAEAAGKCLNYGPAVADYERLSTPEGEDQPRDDLLSDLISQVAPHVDIWIIQLAKHQSWTDNGHDYDGNPYTMQDFENWISKWTSWIKTANPSTEVWTQLGIGQNIPGQGCQIPKPPEYLLEYREVLIGADVDGLFIMPAMPCQYSEDPTDHELYLQYLATIQDAIELACGQPSSNPTFIDVPFDHPFHDEIETIYQAGYTAGCSTDPLMYCPEETMDRAESAVFVERGIHGVEVFPDEPSVQIFADIEIGIWANKWASALYDDGYTAGCGTDPLIYCPWEGHTRAEGSVFYLRMLHGPDYVPLEPQGIFPDVPVDTWYAKWVEAAYTAGLTLPCEEDPLTFCPEDPLTRAMAAYMMVQAKGMGN